MLLFIHHAIIDKQNCKNNSAQTFARRTYHYAKITYFFY